MVLRKPYKFLIKHFRIIHLLLALMSSYLLYRTNGLIKFFNDYINGSETLVGIGTSDEYFSLLMILFIVFILIGLIAILIIMKMKDKPVLFYTISIIAYIVIGLIYLYDKSMIQKLELSTLDIRTIKLASDFTLICFLTQTFSIIILFVRGIGFSVKKFNFEQDLRFDIDESDNEEFEFDVSIDKNRIQRNFKKSLRDIKYTYHENKFIINIITIAVILLIGLLIFIHIRKNRNYKLNQYISAYGINYTISDSYLINTDYKGNEITKNYLVVAKIKVKSTLTTKQKLVTARMLLHIGKISYNPTTKYSNKIIDLGTTYNDSYLKSDYNDYLIVFEIPRKYINKKMVFSYNDPYNGSFKTNLKTKKFEEKTNTETSSLNNEMTLNDSLFKNIKLKINNYEIADKIRATYRFCETKTICYDSYEYIVPTLTDNYTKAILKINSTIDFDNQKISGYDDIADFIETFGSIKYKVKENNELVEKEMNTKIKRVSPVKSNENGVYYFEIYSDIKNATDISLILTVRNAMYEYKLKNN